MKNIGFIKQLKKDNILFSWSYVLKQLWLITRDYSDIDIIMDYSLYDTISTMYWSDYDFTGVLDTKVKTIKFDDETKVDIFFRKDFKSLDRKNINTDLFWPVYHIIPEEIVLFKTYLVLANNQKDKHLKDISEVTSNLLNKIVVVKDEMPF